MGLLVHSLDRFDRVQEELKMSLKTYQKEVEHLRESQDVRDHDHDMVHDLSRR